MQIMFSITLLIALDWKISLFHVHPTVESGTPDDYYSLIFPGKQSLEQIHRSAAKLTLWEADVFADCT